MADTVVLSAIDSKMLRAARIKAAEFCAMPEASQQAMCFQYMQGIAAVIGIALHNGETSDKADMIRRLDNWIADQ